MTNITKYAANYSYTMKTGRLTRDPNFHEITTEDGEIIKVCNLSFAHNYVTDGGNDAVSYHEVALWRKDAETAKAMIDAGKLRKGSLVMVHGKETRKTRTWQGKKYVNNVFENALVSVWDKSLPGKDKPGAWAEVTIRAKAEAQPGIQATAEPGIVA